MKLYSMSIAIKDMKIKTTVRHHYTSLWMSTIKKIVTILNGGNEEKRLDHSHITNDDVKWYPSLEKVWWFL